MPSKRRQRTGRTSNPQESVSAVGGGTSLADRIQTRATMGAEASAVDLLLGRIARRRKFVAETLGEVETARAYIESQIDAEEIERRIEEIVALNKRHILGLQSSNPDQYEGLAKGDVLERFLALVRTHRVDHSEAFTGEPGPPTIPQLFSLLQQSLDPTRGELVVAEYRSRAEFLSTRWRSLVGTDLEPDSPLEELLSLKAPVPCRPPWTEDLAFREQRVLEGGASRRREALLPEPGREVQIQPNPPVEEESEATGGKCVASEIIQRAGGRPLHHPESARDRFTFPGLDRLTEDIFFDYSVIIPVDDRANQLKPREPGVHERATLAAKIAAGQAEHILGFHGMEDVFPASKQHLEETLERVANLSADAPESDVRDLRRELRQAASQVRAIRRFALDVGGDASTDALTQTKTDLIALLETIPRTRVRQHPLPCSNALDTHKCAKTEEELRETLRASGVPGDILELEISDGSWSQIDLPVWGGAGFIWPPSGFRTVDYLLALGSRLARLEELRLTGWTLIDALEEFLKAGSSSSGSEWSIDRRFHDRSLYDLRSTLARILDELAQILTLPPQEPREGNYRLGVQLIYRQFWFPEGYLRGKLTGYKTLPPDTEQIVRRRTGIRTKTQLSSVEDFAIAQEGESRQTLKEASEITHEMTERSSITLSASGHFDLSLGFLGGGGEIETGTRYDLGQVSKAAKRLIGEATRRATYGYNERREVKITEAQEAEEELEYTDRVRNLNKEITANYFYYQLLRQYLVTTRLHDIRPVLLRSKEVPTEAEIDDRFLRDHIHVLERVLPSRLATDLVENVDRIEGFGGALVQAIDIVQQREAAYTAFRSLPRSGDDWEERLKALEQDVVTARDALLRGEDVYQNARSRLDRVLGHVRENRCHYMQSIWSANPKVDEDNLLSRERFGGYPLPQVTRGLIREGYHGQEEVFAYGGPSLALVEVLLENTLAGADIRASMTEDEFRKTELVQYLTRYYADDQVDRLDELISKLAFVKDPAGEDSALSSRRVQVAQDALVVDAMPGQVPLLEGYQMAQRALAVERECLHNEHLRGRIVDRTWNSGTDTLRTYRREGTPVPVREQEPDEPGGR